MNGKKRLSVFDQRWPTKHARDRADEALDNLPISTPLSECIDTWLRVYREAGGIEKRRD